MVKVLISSKYLAEMLNKHDTMNFKSATLIKNELTLYDYNGSGVVLLNVDSSSVVSGHLKKIKQLNRRWDWVKKLVNQVDEQPIVLEIHQNVVNVIFQY